MADVKPIPDGYPQVTPYLIVDGAGAAIDFYSEGARRHRADAHAGARRQDRPRRARARRLGDHAGRRAPGDGRRRPRSRRRHAGDRSASTSRTSDAAVRARADRRRDGTVAAPSRTSSTATARASSRTRSGTAGTSPRTSRTYRRRRWRSAPPSDGRLSRLRTLKRDGACTCRPRHPEAPCPGRLTPRSAHARIDGHHLLSIQSCDLSGERPHLTNRTLAFLAFFDFLAFFLWLSRPEIWFDCSFSRLLYDSASPPFA